VGWSWCAARIHNVDTEKTRKNSKNSKTSSHEQELIHGPKRLRSGTVVCNRMHSTPPFVVPPLAITTGFVEPPKYEDVPKSSDQSSPPRSSRSSEQEEESQRVVHPGFVASDKSRNSKMRQREIHPSQAKAVGSEEANLGIRS
jgi:hypothetical protein